MATEINNLTWDMASSPSRPLRRTSLLIVLLAFATPGFTANDIRSPYPGNLLVVEN